MFRFEKLDVWQKAIALAGRNYNVTSRFPDNERFGLVSQLRRAAVSISSNIAEGSGRSSAKEFVCFIDISFGSLMEVVSQIQIALNQSYLTPDDHRAIYSDAEELAHMLSGLRSSIEARDRTSLSN